MKGTTVGAYTDENGKFSLEAPEDATALVFSFVGRETKEVPITGEVVNVSLSEQAYVLDEVIVTALNINREKRSLGYAAQEVSGDKASVVRDQNLVSALAGKVAGVQVSSATGAGLGGSANIRIRGANSLTGGSPLFVVDGTPISNANFSDSYRGNDYGNIAQDINMDDVESITVLKGPAATALYGNRAASGVILVTTKKGTRRQGIGVDFNSSVSFDNVYIMPDYQNEYAGGYTQEWETAIDPVDGREYKVLRFSADESWGPKIDGTLYRPWWTWYPGTPDYGKEVPLTAHPDNVRNFYETGVTFNNNVSFAGGNENTSFRLSYTNVDQTGVFPNSSLKRNNINLNASTKLSDRLELAANVNISNTNGHGRPQFGYVGNNPALSFNQWFQRQLDIDRLRDYRNEDGTFRSWNIRSATNLRPLYWDSPFFSVYENYSTDSRDRYFGNISLTYNITDHLSIKGVARRDNYTVRVEERIASGGLDQDSYSEVVRNGREDNFEFLLQYDKHLGDVSLNANVGGNLRINDYHSNTMATAGGLNAPNLFNI
ncbi:MAG: SusC/RagA family TonB-linked outer membrane protein, partial [Bacteroidetes bacterium]